MIRVSKRFKNMILVSLFQNNDSQKLILVSLFETESKNVNSCFTFRNKKHKE